MSQDSVNEQIDKMVRARNLERDRLKALRGKLAEIGNSLASLGTSLANQPEMVVLMGQPSSYLINSQPHTFPSSLLDPVKIGEMVQDVRDTEKRIAEQTARLGGE